jgi:hypothetical protein
MPPISPAEPLTPTAAANFCRAPESILHRQYEALRAYYPGAKVAHKGMGRESKGNGGVEDHGRHTARRSPVAR